MASDKKTPVLRRRELIVAAGAALAAPLSVYAQAGEDIVIGCLLYTSPSPRDQRGSRMPSSA